MTTKKKTTIATPEQEYKKELRRIKQFIYRASKRGFFWGESPIPKKPKKITTASVNKLKRITPDVLYKKGEYVDIETGEIISGTKGRMLERNRAGKKDTTKVKSKKVEPRKGIKHKGAEETNKKDKKKPQKTPKQKPTINEAEPTYAGYYPKQTGIVLHNVRSMIDEFMPSANWSPSTRQRKERDKSLLSTILDNAIAEYGEDAVAYRLEHENADRIYEIVTSVLYDSDGERVGYNLTEFSVILNGGALTADEANELAQLQENSEWWESPSED